MYLTKHTIDTTDPKYQHFRDEKVLRYGTDEAHPDYLWQKDTRGEILDLSGCQFQFANFSDERKAKIPMTVPKGYIKNKFQLETFIFSEGKKYVLTLFVKKPQLKHIVKRGQGYPATNVPLILIGRSVEWKHLRDGVLSRALVVHKVLIKRKRNSQNI